MPGYAALACALTGRWSLWPVLLGIGLGFLLTGFGVASVMSALKPFPVPGPGENPFGAPPGSSALTVVLQAVAGAAVFVLNLPLLALGIGAGSHHAAFGDHEDIVFGVEFDRSGRGNAVAMEKTVSGKFQRHRLRCGDDGSRRVIGGDKFFFPESDPADFVFADQFVRSPAHAFRLRVLVGLAVNNDAAVENPGILVELPAEVVVAGSGMFRAGDIALNILTCSDVIPTPFRLRNHACTAIHASQGRNHLPCAQGLDSYEKNAPALRKTRQ